MKKIGICGHFAFGETPEGGQTIKTRIISEELIKNYGKENIEFVDTNNWKKNKVSLLLQCVKLSYRCKNIIILPAHNGVKIFVPLFVFLTKMFNRKLHYIVVGAWLAEKLAENNFLLKKIKLVDFIYIQTETLRTKLKYLKVNDNLYLMPNFKPIVPLSERFYDYKNHQTLDICILSRINEKKGIEAAIKVVNKINNRSGKKKVRLDIYGPVETKYEKTFAELISSNTNIMYKGSVNYNETIDILKNYYLLLFPTRYYTEGFPGTIIDAYSAGLPVLASRWESSTDIIKEKYTGYTYDFDSEKDFFEKLVYLLENRVEVEAMMVNCLKEAAYYTPENALKNLYNNLQ